MAAELESRCELYFLQTTGKVCMRSIKRSANLESYVLLSSRSFSDCSKFRHVRGRARTLAHGDPRVFCPTTWLVAYLSSTTSCPLFTIETFTGNRRIALSI